MKFPSLLRILFTRAKIISVSKFLWGLFSAGRCHNSISWSPIENWMLQYYLRQLGAAREGVGEGLAVTDVDESYADARLVAMAKNLHTWNQMNQLLMQMFFLQGKTCALGFN